MIFEREYWNWLCQGNMSLRKDETILQFVVGFDRGAVVVVVAVVEWGFDI